MSRGSVGRGLTASLALGVGLFLFLPLVVYGLNPASVDTPKNVLLLAGGFLALLMFLTLGALSAIPRIGKSVAVLCQVGAVAVFVLTLFPNRTGQVSGMGDFLRGAGDLGSAVKLTVVLLAAGVFAVRSARGMRTLTAYLLACALLIVGAVALFVTSTADKAHAQERQGRESFCELGSRSNVVVIAFDGFTGQRAREAFDELPEARAALSGFTLYPRAISSAVNTPAGLSALLTGDLALAVEVTDATERMLKSVQTSFLTDAQKAGYRTGFVSILANPAMPTPVQNEQELPARGAPTIGERFHEYAAFWSVSLSRILPPCVFTRVQYRLERFLRAGPRVLRSDWDVLQSLQSISEKRVLSAKMAMDFFVQSLRVENGPPRALFYHSKMSHAPHVVSEDGGFDRAAGYIGSSRHVVKTMAALCDRLKELGCYDSSLIIFTADHGDMPYSDLSMNGLCDPAHALPAAFNPLILVKPPFSGGEFRTSTMTVWLGDVAATVRDYLRAETTARPMIETRSLLQPDDSDRMSSLPIVFRPDQLDYYGPLKTWARVDVLGRFEDYVRASHDDPDAILHAGAHARLFSGEDAMRNELAATGQATLPSRVFTATIDADNRLLAKLWGPGVAIVSNESGAFRRRIYSEAREGLKALQAVPATATTLAVGLRLPVEEVRKTLPRERPEVSPEATTVNFVYGRGGPFAKPELRLGSGDVSLEVAWR